MMDESLKSKLAALGMRTGTQGINPAQSTPGTRLEDLVEGHIKSNMFGETLVIDKIYPGGYKHGFTTLSVRPGAGWIASVLKQLPATEISSDQYVYLDVETTSLSTGAGSYPFLIGLCRILPEAVEVSLLIMRSLSEEKAMLAELISQCAKSKVVITYNGTSFDLPMIRSRLSMFALPDPFIEMIYIDLLPVTRKLWKNTLPSRSLSHLEMTLLGVSRSQIEVPGYLIPQIYFDYLKTGDARPLLGVLYHNEMDILSLAALFNFLADETTSVEILNHLPAMEQKAILKILLDLGEAERVVFLLNHLEETDLLTMDPGIIKRLISWCRTNNRFEEMIRLLDPLSQQKNFRATEELSNYYDRNEKDYARAISLLVSLREDILQSSLPPFSKTREVERVERKLARLSIKQNWHQTR